MSWTNVSKPTGASYTNVNTQGKEQYDQVNISYDDTNIYYDGVFMGAWTNLLKPTGNSSATILPGMATGLLIPFTYSTQHVITGDDWTKISKPV